VARHYTKLIKDGKGITMDYIRKRAYISPMTRRLITAEAMKLPRIPRSILAENLLVQLKQQYGGEDAPLPVKETLEKLISKARNVDTKAWNLGMMCQYCTDINPDAVPYILAVQNWLDKQDWRNERQEWLGIESSLTVKEAQWIARLFRIARNLEDDEIARLYRAAHWYAIHEVMHEMSGKDEDQFDTTEIDTALRTGRMAELFERQFTTAIEDRIDHKNNMNRLFNAVDKLNGTGDIDRYETVHQRLITRVNIDNFIEKQIEVGNISDDEIENIRKAAESIKRDPNLLDVFYKLFTRQKHELEFRERYGKLSPEQVNMLMDYYHSENHEKWIQDHRDFCIEMQEKEANKNGK